MLPGLWLPGLSLSLQCCLHGAHYFSVLNPPLLPITQPQDELSAPQSGLKAFHDVVPVYLSSLVPSSSPSGQLQCHAVPHTISSFLSLDHHTCWFLFLEHPFVHYSAKRTQIPPTILSSDITSGRLPEYLALTGKGGGRGISSRLSLTSSVTFLKLHVTCLFTNLLFLGDYKPLEKEIISSPSP